MTRMNDPWDVKCVRQAGQYVSCMKINGVPLLPPVLSKECRKEMQYYKLLAKEVDKRISLLQPFVADSDSDSEDRTDAPELPECEYELPQEQVKPGYYSRKLKKSVEPSPRHATSSPKHASSPPKRASSPTRHIPPSPRNARATDVCNNITSNVTVETIETRSRSSSPKLVIDLNLSINNESGKKVVDIVRKTPSHSPPQIDLPERDYNCTTRITRKVITEKEVRTETQRNKKQKLAAEVADFNLHNILTDPFADNMSQDGPASLSSKSFTGSLNDLHRDSQKDLHDSLPLARQRSYTLLNPSPQLLAHLKVQSLNTGVEMSCISMSESLSSLSPTKKRRSWDLETAKVKWSTMALELKQTKANNLNRNASNKIVVKQQPKPSTQTTPINRPKSIFPDKTKRTNRPMIKCNPTPNSDTLPKSEPVSKTRKSNSPVRNNNNITLVKDSGSTKTNKNLDPVPQSHTPAPLISESEDPAARVRELYEKIQNQQLLQMASLVEKQKREQMLLQQVFEEQNNLLFKQLKTICPTSPIEVKEAWVDKHTQLEQCQESDRGPVSLSQLINYKSPDQSSLDSPVSSTLTNTNNYINQCDSVLKKSRDITGSIKKQPIKTRSQNGTKIVTQKTQTDGSRTRPLSPVRNTPSPPQRNTPTSRRLNYETSASSDRDYEPMLTDRTNDTMADLNVTFPSDNDDGNFYADDNNSVVTSHIYGKEVKTIHATSAVHSNSAESAIRNMERSIHNSINSTNSLACRAKFNMQEATSRERAAATKIVALAKGYLVRRLMRTERVQATVQTIKDALLCALQLHQDREGIRGADVDLHRRLIQQITAACYSLHDTFVASTAAERCAMIAADRGRRRSIAARQLSNSNSFRQTDLMSQSHTGAFPARTKRPTTTSLMTQSNYETFSDDKSSGGSVSRHMASPHRRPWR